MSEKRRGKSEKRRVAGAERSFRSSLLAPRSNGGFTLLEMMIVIAITVILGAVSLAYFGGLSRGTETDLAAKRFASDATLARTRAMAGEDGRQWGIHAVNSTSDYYEIFSSPTNYSDGAKTVRDTVYLPGGIVFTDPVESATKDILFVKPSGTVASQTSVTIQGSASSSTIIVSTLGAVTIQ